MTETPPNPIKTSDIKCLRCGAFNVVENRICGKCGASLPVVYDEEGKVFNWREDSHLKELLEPAVRYRRNPQTTGWILRFAVILFALLMAFWIMHRR